MTLNVYFGNPTPFSATRCMCLLIAKRENNALSHPFRSSLVRKWALKYQKPRNLKMAKRENGNKIFRGEREKSLLPQSVSPRNSETVVIFISSRKPHGKCIVWSNPGEEKSFKKNVQKCFRHFIWNPFLFMEPSTKDPWPRSANFNASANFRIRNQKLGKGEKRNAEGYFWATARKQVA